MEEQMESLGYTLTRAEGITGFTALLDTGRQGPTVMILGELDAVICPTHPESDPQTGAVHACGHNSQCAALLGIAAALKEPGILDKFCGKILLCAVPAEEMLELDYRTKLIEQGVIRYMGGKSEFLSRGLFDGVDMAFKPELVTEEFIRTVKSAGYEFHVWTIDDLARAELAFKRGAQTVTTNNAKKLLDQYRAKNK
jgi:metal-dependent amidase/aminoacylase/carboxypeptidase family protein